MFGGPHDGPIEPDPAEVSEWKWMRYGDLTTDVRARPEAYTVWFRKYVAAHGGLILGWLAATELNLENLPLGFVDAVGAVAGHDVVVADHHEQVRRSKPGCTARHMPGSIDIGSSTRMSGRSTMS